MKKPIIPEKTITLSPQLHARVLETQKKLGHHTPEETIAHAIVGAHEAAHAPAPAEPDVEASGGRAGPHTRGTEGTEVDKGSASGEPVERTKERLGSASSDDDSSSSPGSSSSSSSSSSNVPAEKAKGGSPNPLRRWSGL